MKIDWTQVSHLIELGKTDSEVSNILRCSISSVRRIRGQLKRGRERHQQNNPTPMWIRLRITKEHYLSMLEKMYSEGLSMTKIAKQLGAHQRTIEAHFTQHSLKRKKNE